MISLDVIQGSAAWHMARLGIPTASHLSRIITPKTRKLSSSADGYMYELLAEWATGLPMDAVSTPFMERGTKLEPDARGYYELQRGIEVQKIGFCLRDDHMIGCSPDGLVGSDGGLEIKCPSASKHIANLIDMTEDHFTQVQAGLWITGRKWWDLLSYHPDITPAITRFERDEEYLAALEPAVNTFVARLLEARKSLMARGVVPASRLDPSFLSTLTS